MTNAYAKLLRPQQWVKNAFVFLPAFFGGALTQPQIMFHAFVAFMTFSLTASAVYCFNDIADAEADRHHPVKCRRPIASGAVSIRQAYSLMGGMALLALLSLLLLPSPLRLATGTVIGIYFMMNLCYCKWLKHYAILDVCIVSAGFVLRIIAGSQATSTPITHWIVLMTFLLTLFLSFAKRRDDVLRMMQTGEAPRKNTHRYNLAFIDQVITITAAITLVCYVMYTVSPEVIGRFHTDKLYLTSIIVLLGLLRYIQVTVVDERSGDPTSVLLSDRPLQVVVACWLLAFLLIIYLF